MAGGMIKLLALTLLTAGLSIVLSGALLSFAMFTFGNLD